MADMKISGLGNQAIQAYKNTANMVETGGNSSAFSGMVNSAVKGAVDSLRQGELISNKALVNEAGLDELAVSVANAEMTLRTVVAVRDRIISAYQDIIKMPI